MDAAHSVRVNFGRAIPIFPLDAVLLPQQPMPLHIFEPRYRQLIEDELDGVGQLAIATLDPSGPADENGQARVRPAVCVGQIVTHERLPDGRFMIVLHGLCRARIVEFVASEEGRLYRRAMLDPFGDASPDAAGDLEAMEQLRAWVDDALEEGPLSHLRLAEQVLEYVRNDVIPTPVLLDVVGFTMLGGRETRYRMLSEPSPHARTALLYTELRRLARIIRAARSQGAEHWPKGLSWN